MSYKQYLKEISNAKYGVCLKGNNSKSTRLIEYLAMGTVPIVVDNCVNTSSYTNPLQDNNHFLSVNNVAEIPMLIQSITDDKWEEMSKYGHEWYFNNVHSINSFKHIVSTSISLK